MLSVFIFYPDSFFLQIAVQIFVEKINLQAGKNPARQDIFPAKPEILSTLMGAGPRAEMGNDQYRNSAQITESAGISRRFLTWMVPLPPKVQTIA